MELDLSSLKEIGSRKTIKKKIELPDLTYRKQEIATPFPFDVELNVSRTRDSYLLQGNFSGILVLTCSRCLEKFDYKIELIIEEEILKKDIEDPTEVDITDLFIENILLAIPIKAICSDECKGLCSNCGANLNKEECGCQREVVDPRLAKLKDYFKDK